jgi:hypothetical protein
VIITCGGCKATWSGLSFAHCAKCHTTFSGVTGFDRHRMRAGRKSGQCLSTNELREIGYSPSETGVWGTGSREVPQAPERRS